MPVARWWFDSALGLASQARPGVVEQDPEPQANKFKSKGE